MRAADSTDRTVLRMMIATMVVRATSYFAARRSHFLSCGSESLSRPHTQTQRTPSSALRTPPGRSANTRLTCDMHRTRWHIDPELLAYVHSTADTYKSAGKGDQREPGSTDGPADLDR
jgi:hypothetical protein